MPNYFLEQNDPELFGLVKDEWVRQNTHLEMIASENYTFESVMEAMGSVLTNKYAEGYPSKRYYGGCEVVDKIESLAIERAKKLFNCAFVNVQPHSGSQANMAIYHALLKPHDKILSMELSSGGHLTHASKVSMTGQHFQGFHYGVNAKGWIDYEEVHEIAQIVRPKIIVCGYSAYPREIDFKRFRQIADSVGAYLMGDIAHIAGLVVAGEHPHPLPHCHVISSTTHKTLRGPRGGLVFTNDEEIATKVNKALFPGTQGGPLMHVIAGKAAGFLENLKPEWRNYAKAVKTHTQVLVQGLLEQGFHLVSGGSDNHLLVMRFEDFSGKEAEEALGRAGIIVNKNTVPGDMRSPLITSGIRLGAAALTSRGLDSKDFAFIAVKIAQVLNNIKGDQSGVYKEIEAFSQGHPTYTQPIF
ncbi:Serine hydroxymethyltransferase GlyA [Helicobacter sp. NHP19-003]|uniref:Serine hydroxymethyltransferase n=1 Tax=Helicobacter gastrocanis TaxID=2849641 RepID=A0ABM7S812_9HELI|nr:serine hydroxymethyltransferase [Helicobacter sp. NHP19-003]BCZ16727.1 Serine hydroxymethyltransferase GlyA [Helicobacter sp. NHP19-003]